MEWVWLLNNDTLLEPDCVERLMEHVEAHPEVEMTDREKIEVIGRRILRRFRDDFLELAR